MTAIVPSVNVHLEKTPSANKPGMASKIAVIGAFDSTETNPIYCGSLAEAYTQLGTDKTTYKGVSCLDKLFTGASEIIAVNFTTKSGSTIDTTLTTEKLTNCLAKIKGEDFDLLFVAENVEDTAIAIIKQFVEDSFEIKCPCGYVLGITRANTSGYTTTAGAVGDWCYGIITQQMTVDGTEYSIVDSGAYYCGLLAGLNVGNSMTMKTVPNVSNVNPELTFETGDAGLSLLQAGITTLKCQDRANKTFVVVNSELPNGYDLYINRTRDFVVKSFNLHNFLGERNREATLDEIKQELATVKTNCVNTLDLLLDINYTVQKGATPNCVDIYIDSLVFAGVITKIDVYVKVEVE